MTRRIRLAGLASLALALFFVIAPGLRAEGPFAIKDGDRVVFYGDSITDQRLYTTFVETYIVTRFPAMNVSFVHSGWGGDRVTGGGGGPIDRRLERDVFAYKPTVVTVMLGMNDASYQPFKQEIFDVYAKGYQHLVESLKSNLPGVRITLIQPSPFDDVTRKPNFEGGYNQVLIRYGEFVKDAGREGRGDGRGPEHIGRRGPQEGHGDQLRPAPGTDPRPGSSRSRGPVAHGRGTAQGLERPGSRLGGRARRRLGQGRSRRRIPRSTTSR